MEEHWNVSFDNPPGHFLKAESNAAWSDISGNFLSTDIGASRLNGAP